MTSCSPYAPHGEILASVEILRIAAEAAFVLVRAEGVGFEPTSGGNPEAVFKTAAIGH